MDLVDTQGISIPTLTEVKYLLLMRSAVGTEAGMPVGMEVGMEAGMAVAMGTELDTTTDTMHSAQDLSRYSSIHEF